MVEIGDNVLAAEKIGKIERLVADQGLWEIRFFDGSSELFSEDEIEYNVEDREVDVSTCPVDGRNLTRDSETIFKCEKGCLLSLKNSAENPTLTIGWEDQNHNKYNAKVIPRR